MWAADAHRTVDLENNCLCLELAGSTLVGFGRQKQRQSVKNFANQI